MLKRLVILTACFSALVGCVETTETKENKLISAEFKPVDRLKEASTLEAWWSFFGDPILDKLVSSAISLDSRGGMNKTLSGATSSYEDLREFYRPVEIDLILAVTRNYVDYRYVQNQIDVLTNYMNDRERALSKIKDSKDKSAIQIKSAQSTLLKQKISLEMQAGKLLNKITILTNLLPEYVAQVLKSKADMPNSDIMPVLASSVSVIENSPDVLAAKSMYGDNNVVGAYAVFPDTTVNRFFGIADDVFLPNNTIWSVSIGESVSRLDFSSVPEDDFGNIFKQNISNITLDLEHLVVSYAHIQEQYNVLKNSAEGAKQEYLAIKQKAYSASLVMAGENSYNARIAALRAEYEKIKIAVNLYEALGAY